jgi:hypothetical protein
VRGTRNNGPTLNTPQKGREEIALTHFSVLSRSLLGGSQVKPRKQNRGQDSQFPNFFRLIDYFVYYITTLYQLPSLCSVESGNDHVFWNGTEGKETKFRVLFRNSALSADGNHKPSVRMTSSRRTSVICQASYRWASLLCGTEVRRTNANALYQPQCHLFIKQLIFSFVTWKNNHVCLLLHLSIRLQGSVSTSRRNASVSCMQIRLSLSATQQRRSESVEVKLHGL